MSQSVVSPESNLATRRPPSLWLWVLAAACAGWGIVLLARPSDATSTVARLIGIGLILLGGSFLARSRSTQRPLFDRIDGVTWFGIGLLAVVWPDPSVRWLAILVGVALVVTGALEVAGAVRGVGNERLMLAIGGLTSIGFGIAAVAWPTVTTLVLSVVVGARLIIAAAGLVAAIVGAGRSAANGEVRGGWRARTRTAVAVAGLLAAGAAAVVSVAVNRAQPDGPGAFYDAPDALPGGPGTLIRSELVEPFIDGATAYRVLYVTSDAQGRPTTSSGLVIVPEGQAPDGGRPVLAFTHGTIGIDRRCSPSLLPGDVYGPAIPGIRDFLDAGFVISATDYAGLGSDAITAYLVGTSQAYSTLDGIRATTAMPEAAASRRAVVFGESQGGHAALFTGQFAPTYAPDVELMGVAAAAPATDLESLFQENVGTTFGDVLASYALSSWADVYGAQLSDIAEPQAMPVIERIAKQCIQTPTQMLALVPEAELLKIQFLRAQPWDTEPWATILAENTPGGSPIAAPVLIAQGADDPLVLPSVQQAFVDGWCARGQSIEYQVYEGVGHLDAGHASAADVSRWAAARFSGDAWQPTC